MLGNDGSRSTFITLPQTEASLGLPTARNASAARDSAPFTRSGVGQVPAASSSARPPGGVATPASAPHGSSVQTRMRATPEAPARARQVVDEALRSWDMPERLRIDAVLAVSELVSDAATYPLAVDVELELAYRGERVELVVRDSCPEPPLRVDPASGAGELGRAVLDACSDHWSWSPQPRTGREVRAVFRA